MTFLIPWFAALGALIIGVAVYRDDKDEIIRLYVLCSIAYIKYC